MPGNRQTLLALAQPPGAPLRSAPSGRFRSGAKALCIDVACPADELVRQNTAGQHFCSSYKCHAHETFACMKAASEETSPCKTSFSSPCKTLIANQAPCCWCSEPSGLCTHPCVALPLCESAADTLHSAISLTYTHCPVTENITAPIASTCKHP